MTLVASIAVSAQSKLEEIAVLIAKEDEMNEKECEKETHKTEAEKKNQEKTADTPKENIGISSPIAFSPTSSSQDARKVSKQESFMSQFKGIILKDQTQFKLASIKQERKKLDQVSHFISFYYFFLNMLFYYIIHIGIFYLISHIFNGYRKMRISISSNIWLYQKK